MTAGQRTLRVGIAGLGLAGSGMVAPALADILGELVVAGEASPARRCLGHGNVGRVPGDHAVLA